MNKIKKMHDWLYWLLMKLLLAIILDGILIAGGMYVYMQYISEEGINLKVREIYQNIVVQTGQYQDVLQLSIVDKDEDNASNDGNNVVIYTGFIKKHSWDEIAMVLGHEVAHGLLGHLNKQAPVPETDDVVKMGTDGYQAVLEANADKMGAIYMIKAGYNICEGRKLYKEWKKESGDYQAQDHPDYAYRYEELNINCGRD